MYSSDSLRRTIRHLSKVSTPTGNALGMLEYAEAMAYGDDDAANINAVVAAAVNEIKDDDARFAVVHALLGDEDDL